MHGSTPNNGTEPPFEAKPRSPLISQARLAHSAEQTLPLALLLGVVSSAGALVTSSVMLAFHFPLHTLTCLGTTGKHCYPNFFLTTWLLAFMTAAASTLYQAAMCVQLRQMRLRRGIALGGALVTLVLWLATVAVGWQPIQATIGSHGRPVLPPVGMLRSCVDNWHVMRANSNTNSNTKNSDSPSVPPLVDSSNNGARLVWTVHPNVSIYRRRGIRNDFHIIPQSATFPVSRRPVSAAFSQSGIAVQLGRRTTVESTKGTEHAARAVGATALRSFGGPGSIIIPPWHGRHNPINKNMHTENVKGLPHAPAACQEAGAGGITYNDARHSCRISRISRLSHRQPFASHLSIHEGSSLRDQVVLLGDSRLSSSPDSYTASAVARLGPRSDKAAMSAPLASKRNTGFERKPAAAVARERNMYDNDGFYTHETQIGMSATILISMSLYVPPSEAF